MNNRKDKKYLTGGKIHNYIEDPGEELTKLQIDMAKVKNEVNNDFLANTMDMLTGLSGQALGAAFSGSGSGMGDMKILPGAQVERAATGGTTGNNIEIERGEVVERPDGMLLDFREYGKSHKAGGIKLSSKQAPPGSDVHSDKIKINGKSMADIKMAYEKKSKKLDKLMSENPTDKNLKKTKELFEQGYAKVNERNMMIQNILKQANNYMATGGTIDDLEEEELMDLENYAEENDMDIEEAYESLYNTDEEEEDLEEDYDEDSEDLEEDYEDYEEDDEDEEFVTGGTNPIKPFNRLLGKYADNKYIKDPNLLRGALGNLGIDLDLDNPESIGAYQDKLGLKIPKSQRGIYGPKTSAALDSYIAKNNITPDFGAPIPNFEKPPEFTPSTNNQAESRNRTIEGSLFGDTFTPNEEFLSRANTNYDDIDEEEDNESFLSRMFGNYSTGDILGLAGTAYGSIAGRNNTEANRAGDKPNINPFLGYGDEAMRILNKSGENLEFQKDEAMRNTQLNRNAALSRARNGARSINTMRGLDIATDASISQQEGKILSDHAARVSDLMKGKAALSKEQDLRVMTGKQLQDMNDRRDRDNYYSQRGQDIQSQATGLQMIGKHLNKAIERDMMGDLLEGLSEHLGVKVTAEGIEFGNKKSKPSKKKKK